MLNSVHPDLLYIKDFLNNQRIRNNSTIWEINVDFVIKKIMQSTNLNSLFKDIIGPKMYEFSAEKRNFKQLITFYRKEFLKLNFDINNINVNESKLYPKSQLIKFKQSYISSELLYKLLYAKRISFLLQKFSSKKVKSILEIGGGFGSLARYLSNDLKNIKNYVLIDIPETLSLAYVYLKSISNEKIILLDKNNINKNLSSYKFILATPNYLKKFRKFKFDLLVNTNSFGEFSLSDFKKYKRDLDNFSNIKYIYSLNRFANRADINMLDYRHYCLGNVFNISERFVTKSFNLDPSFERFEFDFGLRTRNLELFLENTNYKNLQHKKYIKKKFDSIKNINIFRHKNLFPKLQTRTDLFIEQKYDIDSILFILFENLRMNFNQLNKSKLIKYLIIIGGMQTPFEEVFYLIEPKNKTNFKKKYRTFLVENFELKNYLDNFDLFLSEKEVSIFNDKIEFSKKIEIEKNNSLSGLSKSLNLNNEIYIERIGSFKDNFSKLIDISLKSSINPSFELPSWIKQINDDSGKKIRSFIFNLSNLLKNKNFIEISDLKNSIASCALVNNVNKYDKIYFDDESSINKDVVNKQPYKSFNQNISRHSIKKFKFSYASEFEKINNENYDVVFIKSKNEYQNCLEIFKCFHKFFNENFLLVIDGWNSSIIRDGLNDSLDFLGFEVVDKIIIKSSNSNNFGFGIADDNWNNGYGIFNIKKKAHNSLN